MVYDLKIGWYYTYVDSKASKNVPDAYMKNRIMTEFKDILSGLDTPERYWT